MDGSLEQTEGAGGGAPVIEMSGARLTYEKGGRRVDAIDGMSLSVVAAIARAKTTHSMMNVSIVCVSFLVCLKEDARTIYLFCIA